MDHHRHGAHEKPTDQGAGGGIECAGGTHFLHGENRLSSATHLGFRVARWRDRTARQCQLAIYLGDPHGGSADGEGGNAPFGGGDCFPSLHSHHAAADETVWRVGHMGGSYDSGMASNLYPDSLLGGVGLECRLLLV